MTRNDTILGVVRGFLAQLVTDTPQLHTVGAVVRLLTQRSMHEIVGEVRRAGRRISSDDRVLALYGRVAAHCYFRDGLAVSHFPASLYVSDVLLLLGVAPEKVLPERMKNEPTHLHEERQARSLATAYPRRILERALALSRPAKRSKGKR